MAGFPEPYIDPLAKEAINALLETIKTKLYNRERLDSLFYCSLLSQPNLVEYLERRLRLPITADLNQLFDNYPYKYPTLDASSYFSDSGLVRLTVIYGDYEQVKALTIIDYNQIAAAVFPAASVGNFEVLWHLYARLAPPSDFLQDFMAGATFYGKDRDVLGGITETWKSEVTNNPIESLYLFAIIGAISGGQKEWLDYFSGLVEETNISKYTNGSWVGYLYVYKHLDTNFDTLKYFFTDPKFQKYREEPIIYFNLKTMIVEYGDQKLIEQVVNGGLIGFEQIYLSYGNVSYFKLYEEQHGNEGMAPSIIHSLMERSIKHKDRNGIRYSIEKGFSDWNAAMNDAASEKNLELVLFFEAQGATDFQLAMTSAYTGPNSRNRVYRYLRSKGIPNPVVPIGEDVNQDDWEVVD